MSTKPTSPAHYFSCLNELLLNMQVSFTAPDQATDQTLENGMARAVDILLQAREEQKPVILLGNGGSAAIVAHLHADLANSLETPAICFNDIPLLTAYSNDYGYVSAFERSMKLWTHTGGVIVAISSSGRSENILRAVELAKSAGFTAITMTGFNPDNPLRGMGDVNFYIASDRYGYVESAHGCICHYLTDAALERLKKLQADTLRRPAKDNEADGYHIDGHKLMYHPERVAAWNAAGGEWEKLKRVYPIYLEISPTGACNHRCTFCALDYMGYTPRSLDLEIMRERLAEMGEKGVRSVMFAGEGEPLLHKRINELSHAALDAGIDISFTTNGVLMDARFREQTLPRTKWVKVSCNAGTAATYAAIHNTQEKDFHTVTRNMRLARQARDQAGGGATLGLQMLLLPENAREAEELARIARDEMGADYLVIKPYSQHLSSKTTKYGDLDYEAYLGLADRLAKHETDEFKVVFRAETMRKYRKPRCYDTCLSTPFFWAYVASSGEVYSCSAFLGDERFCLGNANTQSFQEIWEGEARRRNLLLVRNGLDSEQCRSNCRMDAVNRYLWQLKTPHPHVNFI